MMNVHEATTEVMGPTVLGVDSDEATAGWKQGDDPEAHPMWGEQLELEYGMMRAGANKLRDQVITATERRKMSEIGAISNLLTDWLPGVADEIGKWVKDYETTTGPRPLILPLMKTVEPSVAALVGLREIMDRIGQKENANTVQNICMEIGRTLEYEMRVRAWEKGSEQERSLWRISQKEMERNKVTSEHRRRVNINRFNFHQKQGNFDTLTWDAWTTETLFRVGAAITDCVVRFTGWFELISDPSHQFRKGKARDPKLLLVVNLRGTA